MLLLATRARQVLALGSLCFASMLYAYWLRKFGSHETMFFSSFSRAFEPLIGCMTALAYRQYVASPALSCALRAAGLGLIAYAMITHGPKPGFRDLLLPCIGAAAFLFARPDNREPVFRIMASRPFRTVGIMSYSLYLWHWPALVFARIYFGWLDAFQTTGVIVVTLVLSTATLYAVENPIRFGKRLQPARAKLFTMAAASTAAIVIFASAGIQSNGAPGRLPPQVLTITTASAWDTQLYRCFDPPGGPAESVAMAVADTLCTIGDTARERVDFVLWGDSHAFAMSKAFSEWALDAGLKGLVGMLPGCPSLSNTVNSDLGKTQKCVDFYQAVAKAIERHNVRNIFMVDRWSLYSNGEKGSEGYLKFANDWNRRTNPEEVFAVSLDRTVSELSGKRVFFVKEPPLQRMQVTDTLAVNALMGLPASRLEGRWTTLKEHLDRTAFLNRTFDAVKAKYNNVSVLDPLPFLCSGDHCTASKDGLPLYFDDDHLSILGTRLLKPMLAPAFELMKSDNSTTAPR